ncbi:MAG: hypothetical protein JWR80_8841 [Bradyrhizobium sp.]|nr:hypothetical protein [Bradyrhizobium sp.]
MTALNLLPAIARPDDLYEELIEMHRGLDDRQSTVANAKLIMLLANHIGDAAVIREAIGIARGSTAPAASTRS